MIEVALAVQFEPNTVGALHAALLGSRLRERFPKRQEQLARPPIEEDFSPPAPRPPLSLELMAAPPTQRFWFLSDDESQLIQVQHDLLAVNWRRLPGGGEYPRYEALRVRVRESLAALDEILKQEGEGPVKPNWCEVTYINHVLPAPGESERPAANRVLRLFASPQPTLPPPEDVQLNARFRVQDEPGEEPRGRLNLSLASAFRAEDRVPVWVLTLTVRARSRDATTAGALATLDDGRERADKAFDDLTTEEMHETWGLTRRSENELAR